MWALFGAASLLLIGALATAWEWLRTGAVPRLDRLGAALYVVNQGLLAPLSGLALGYVGWWIHPGADAAPLWSRFVFGFLAFEAVTYAYHRAAHRIGPLRRLHRVHHSTGHELTWLGGFRQHPLEFLLMQTLGNLPAILLFGAAGGVSLWLNVGLRLWTAFLHAKGPVRLGPLEWLLVSPSMHHAHHDASFSLSSNYGGLVSVFDRAFGTLTRQAAIARGRVV